MTTRTALRIIGWLSAGLALFTAGVALGQHHAPTDYKGVKESVLAAIDLAKEIDSVDNRELRVSRATVAPGGHIGLHSHQGDPTIVYILAGVLTNHHDDGTTEEFRPGQAFAELARDRIGWKTRGQRRSPSSPQTFIAGNRCRARLPLPDTAPWKRRRAEHPEGEALAARRARRGWWRGRPNRPPRRLRTDKTCLPCSGDLIP
jgi:quercetin dioxygenase-like cupin family protein